MDSKEASIKEFPKTKHETTWVSNKRVTNNATRSPTRQALTSMTLTLLQNSEGIYVLYEPGQNLVATSPNKVWQQ